MTQEQLHQQYSAQHGRQLTHAGNLEQTAQPSGCLAAWRALAGVCFFQAVQLVCELLLAVLTA